MSADLVDIAAFKACIEAAETRFFSAPAEALRLAEEALALLGQPPPPADHARALKVRGNALVFMGRPVEGLTTMQQALAEVPADAPELRVDVLRGIASACEQIGDLTQSLEWGLQAAEAARALGHPGRLADTLLSVGVVRSRAGDHATGLSHYEEALAAYEAEGEVRLMHGALCNMGIACKNLGRFDAAVRHLQRSADIAMSLNDDGLRAMSLVNLGEPLCRLGRLDEALQAATFSARELHQRGMTRGEAHAVLVRGEVRLAMGDAVAAQADMEQALALAQAEVPSLVARSHLALSALHKRMGRFERALQHHEAYHEAERAQFNEESARTLNSLQVRFDLARARHEAQTQRLEAARLAEQTRTDALTGLANRRRLDETLADAFAAARRSGRPLAVAMVDIDDFKRINDAFGHGVGDAVLRTVGEQLRAHCRGTDLVARFGGEEFCIVFGDADAAHAERACETSREAVERMDWTALHPALRVTISIGLADHPAHATPQALLDEADRNLYAAKRAGKNRVV